MKNIGIIGAGVAGLHLGLFLLQRGMSATIYAERSAGDQLGAQLPSLVARHSPTREREKALGVNHWDSAPSGQVGQMRVTVAGEQPLVIRGNLDEPSIVVDMRIYCARLMEDFAARGGKLVVGNLTPADVERLSDDHDLMVVSTGRAGIGAMFPRCTVRSSYDAPQRQIVTAIFRGIAYPQPMGADFVIIPGAGEIFALPIYSFEPGLTGIGVEAIPGGPLEALARMRYQDDPRAFELAMLDVLERLAPSLAARIDPQAFQVTRGLDVMQGAITPTVRRGYTQLANGRFALALGDTHILNDPILGQGANNASHAAWQLGEAICEAAEFNEAFCQAFDERVWGYVGPVTSWNNAMLQPPPAHMVEFLVAAAMHQPVADTFANYFRRPVEGWEVLSNPERSTAVLRSHGWQGMPQMAAAAD
jgi:2-polyprenyl-6-methoxyphenol hydroxylase-like FAD-dependent oxidoreductase